MIIEYGGWLAAMAVTGLVAGFVAGLLGVGGGIVIVPVLDIALAAFDVDPSLRMKVAVATSLATIMATSLASARAHHRAGAVDYALLKSWGPVIFVGVVMGTAIAGLVDGQVLTVVFATTALIVAANMVLRANSHKLFDDFPNGVVKSVLGLLIGTVSAMMGIGGGTLGVPILTIFGKDIRSAVGTASAMGFIIAIPGTVGYVTTGWGAEGLPPLSLGYVNFVAVAAIIPLSMLAAPWGAKTAHSVPRQILAYGFGAFLTLTAIKMFAGLAM